MEIRELLDGLLRQIHDHPVDLLDMAAVAYVVYRGLLIVRGTRAMAIINGLILVLILSWITLPLGTLNFILRHLMFPAVIAIVIIFQPELRMVLERLGRGGFLGETLTELGAVCLAAF